MKRCGVFLTVAAMGLGWVQGSVVLLAGSASGAPAAPAARAVTLTCAGVGDFRVVLRSDATPATATPLPGSVSIRTAYKAVDSRSAATVSGGERGDISCGQVPVHGVSFGALSDGRPPAGVVASDRFDGSVAITLVVTQPKRTLAVAAVPGAGAPFPF
ncbi:MAG: hypothetical protein QOE58_73 [Actinomycetota bacterium]|nr:hypothetical protein [Actinomycetota bacterium]